MCIWRCEQAMFSCGSSYAPCINSHVENLSHSLMPIIMYANDAQ